MMKSQEFHCFVSRQKLTYCLNEARNVSTSAQISVYIECTSFNPEKLWVYICIY